MIIFQRILAIEDSSLCSNGGRCTAGGCSLRCTPPSAVVVVVFRCLVICSGGPGVSMLAGLHLFFHIFSTWVGAAAQNYRSVVGCVLDAALLCTLATLKSECWYACIRTASTCCLAISMPVGLVRHRKFALLLCLVVAAVRLQCWLILCWPALQIMQIEMPSGCGCGCDASYPCTWVHAPRTLMEGGLACTLRSASVCGSLHNCRTVCMLWCSRHIR
ncbi:hypothetical protein COO60DRAFT_1580124 [Scenedesmus sp. NREL 46B-D3]|nr:hypothetical protein COO60DRAFT_1580124 [Scenedesmus sp. NREL 46B-D3]